MFGEAGPPLSGKSTTLRQTATSLKNHVAIRYVNCDRKALDPNNPPSASELLVKFLSPLATRLLEPDEEFTSCWNWGLERYGNGGQDDGDNTSMVLQRAVEELRLKYKADWKKCDVEATAFRIENLHALVCESTDDRLDYLAFKLDYYLCNKCAGDRSRLCIILDNIDPLPPKLQRELLLRVSQFQLNARCKILLAMRPLTYSLTHQQRANRTIKVLQHIGPPALTLIEDRIKRLILDCDHPRLSIRMLADGKTSQELKQDDFKAWVRQVIQDIRASRASGGHRGQRAQEPSALEFIEGLCNNSLRSALLVAEKIFASPNLPMVVPEDAHEVDRTHTTILKNHEIIRAILLGRQTHYASDINRVTDNIFDFGDAATCYSATCKFRILKELSSAPGRGILLLSDIRKRLKAFGFDDQVILEAINGVISQVKRLAWSDMVVVYHELDAPPGSRISISRAGRFYVDKAIYSLEYVQEVHVDVLLPEDLVPHSYVHRNFAERAGSLYSFLRHLHDMDTKEVQTALLDPESSRRYRDTYGATLFSSDMAIALGRQVLNVGNSILRKLRVDDRLHQPTTEALNKWRSLPDLLASMDKPLLETLRT